MIKKSLTLIFAGLYLLESASADTGLGAGNAEIATDATEVVHPRYIEGSSISKSGRSLHGRGNPVCEANLPTLSVGKENLLQTKVEWDRFVKENPFFVVSISDSKCPLCCRAEPILESLENAIKDKAIFSYPEKNVKKKKIVRKEIKIARIDM